MALLLETVGLNSTKLMVNWLILKLGLYTLSEPAKQKALPQNITQVSLALSLFRWFLISY